MKYTFTLAALAALAATVFANPVPQAITADITPTAAAPPGCTPTFPGTFVITITNVTTTSGKRDVDTGLNKRIVSCGSSGTLVETLSGGQLFDSHGRTGYIAANYQFQFDGPPQQGAIYTGGFSVCANGTLALGGSAIFYQCLSGTFYNLYDQSTGGQCSPVFINAIQCVGASGVTTTTTAVSTTVASSSSTTSMTSTTVSISSMTMSSSSTMTTAAVIIPPSSMNMTVVTSAPTAATTATTASVLSSAVIQSSDGQPQKPTGTASATIATSTGAGSVLAVGRELIAFAGAGVAALLMI
ncbi:hypothetical protein MMC18_003603 [Xylographa bjoerkii]|nr:hypothetical protein [Xylographa bjoerkii]